MSPAELANRIAALDWSKCSLQQQLAVGAALKTLKELDMQPNAPANSNVVTLRTHHWVHLMHLDGRPWASAGFVGPDSAWSWIAETVAHELECNEDDVHCLEDPEGLGDLVTVDGVPVYRIAH